MASFHPAATIARIDGRWPSLLPSCSKTGGENERLGGGAYRGCRRRLRHSISVAGPKIPSTKAVKGRSLSPTDKRHHIQLVEVQAIFCRRRHQLSRPPPAKIRPGSPAPTMGPGTLTPVSEKVALNVGPVVGSGPTMSEPTRSQSGSNIVSRVQL